MKAVNIAWLFLFIAVLARTATLTSALQADAIFLLEKSPYHNQIVYATKSGAVIVIDAVSQTPIHARTFDMPPVRLAWANPGEVIIALQSGSILIWNLVPNTDRVIDTQPNQAYYPLISDISVSSNGLLAVAYYTNLPYYEVYNLIDLSQIIVPAIPADEPLYAIAWKPTPTNQLALGGNFGGAFVDISNSTVTIFDEWFMIRALDWSSDGQKLLGGGAGEWTIWDGDTGQVLLNGIGLDPQWSYIYTKWSSNDDLFAISSSGPIELWTASSATLVTTIAIGSNQSAVFDWDPETQTLITPDATSPGGVRTIDFPSSNFNENKECSYAYSH